ncbi:helix-turn-helix domain-containing transcriptional regulator [Bifidobacterium criceti]|uniref:Addiction module antitoxin n=1 Tax=Bifidobacterium criceti TaxID=1960969 RepID=A0A2A2EEK7_9BIFI|nr:hypothetical protein [Bifidobacterium criceti]PAU67420.1 addiction module antitoxin [Bifidobacterium criceti]
MALNTTAWDITEYLEDEEGIAEYLNAVIELNDPVLLQAAIGDIAKTQRNHPHSSSSAPKNGDAVETSQPRAAAINDGAS